MINFSPACAMFHVTFISHDRYQNYSKNRPRFIGKSNMKNRIDPESKTSRTEPTETANFPVRSGSGTGSGPTECHLWASSVLRKKDDMSFDAKK